MLIFLDTNHFSIPCVLSLYFSSSLYFVEFGLIIFTLSLNALRPNRLLPTHQTLNSLSLFFLTAMKFNFGAHIFLDMWASTRVWSSYKG